MPLTQAQLVTAVAERADMSKAEAKRAVEALEEIVLQQLGNAEKVRIGGIVGRAAHPARPDMPLRGGPQMVELSRDGRRIYVTNSLYGAWDDQFYPDGIGAWMAKLDADPANGGIAFDPRFFLEGEVFRGRRVHQVRLQGGDASSDSYCYA